MNNMKCLSRTLSSNFHQSRVAHTRTLWPEVRASGDSQSISTQRPREYTLEMLTRKREGARVAEYPLPAWSRFQ